MKHVKIIGVFLLLSVFIAGCACHSGYYGTYKPFFAPYGSVPQNGFVDYVDGIPTANDCSTGYVNPCNPYRPCGLTNCANCIGNIVNGVFALGEGAFCLAASPFILVGNLLCGGYGGYEMFPNSGCSNELYYGDNCYQTQDLCDPCAGVDPNACNYSATAGCSNCNNNYSEGIQFQNDNSKPVSSYRPITQQSYTVPYVSQTNRTRPISQTMFRQATPSQRMAPPQRMTPPKPQVYVPEYQENSAQ
ncbi:MAG: hypothetical protein LBU34_17370 [Planctomycetaceae bacterium]|jgi:hypothetical protein|nr:hypothetical protein [Planctomycetaceae bacterium]